MAFEKLNINPKGRKTGDCTTRAIAKASGITWQEALRLQYETALKRGWAVGSTENTNFVLKGLGFEEQKINAQRGSKRPTVAKLADEYCYDNLVIFIAHHLTCAVEGDIYDLWNPSERPVYKH